MATRKTGGHHVLPWSARWRPRTSTRTRGALNILAALALNLLVAVCYYPATQGGFV